jgi:hypothetical protein
VWPVQTGAPAERFEWPYHIPPVRNELFPVVQNTAKIEQREEEEIVIERKENRICANIYFGLM